MKKIWLNILIFFHYLARGMRSADNVLATSTKEGEGESSGIEQQKEEKSVYADLLRGEVTQEVKELRHEMYYTERESKHYNYTGNGTAKKITSMFDYNGAADRIDGFKITIIQENKEETASVLECGIYAMGEHYNVTDAAKGDIGTQDIRKFTLNVKRDFIPAFKIEEHATQIVVHKNANETILDIYVSAYDKQFDRKSSMLIKGLEKIYEGDIRSDIIDFNEISFITNGAYGADDLKEIIYGGISFITIKKHNGNFILRFAATPIKEGEDLITEFYDEIAAKKCEEHAPRENATINIEGVIEQEEREKYDAEGALKLLKNGRIN